MSSREPRHNPTVGWFELFYDLVVVASVTLTNDAFLANPSWATARGALLGILALSWVWLLTTLFNNLFPGRDIIRRLLILAQMGAIVTAGLAIDSPTGIDASGALIAYAIALLLVVLLIASDRLVKTPGRRHAQLRVLTIGPLTTAAVLCIVGGVLIPHQAGAVLAVALAISIIPILGHQYRQWDREGLIRLDHMRERLGLFIIIILGEGFAQLVGALSEIGSIPRGGIFALTFLVSFALWWIYFDGTFSEQTELGRVRWRLSLLAHLLLVYGMAGTLDILVLLTAKEEAEFGPRVLRYFSGSVALVLLAFALLRVAARGRLDWAGWLHIGSAVALLAASLLITRQAVDDMYWFIAAAAGLVMVNAAATAWHDHAGPPGSRISSILRGDDPDA